MARGRRRRGRERSPALTLDPEAVLAGRGKPSAPELIELICRVNPTDRDLDRRQTELRYRQKSALQSLLLTRFTEELEVLPASAAGAVGDELVLLRHRPSGREACHALLDELDEEARSRARRLLDIRELRPDAVESEPAAEASPSRRAAPADAVNEDGPSGAELSAPELLAGAEEALGGYDYELARALLQRAVQRSSGALAAARPCLELLVDGLAADADALELSETLPPQTLEDAAIRGLLAVAAARGGEPTRAVQLAGDLTGPRAVEAWVILGRRSLRAGDLTATSEHLAAARQAGPADHQVLELVGELDEARRQRLEPAERELREVLKRGGLEKAEALAKAILEQWPRSEAARDVLRTARQQRQAERVSALLERAERARAAGDLAVAVARYEAALEAGAAPDAVAGELEQTREELTRERAAEQVDAVLAALTGDGRRAQAQEREQTLALTSYRELPEPLRARVRTALGTATAQQRRLAQLDAVRLEVKTARAVGAVLALAAAEALMERGRVEQAIARLEPHARELRGVPDARALRELAAARLAEEAAQRTQQALERAEAHVTAGELEKAAAALRDVKREAPAGELGDRAERLSRAVDVGLADQMQVARFDRMMREANLPGARLLAAKIVAAGDGGGAAAAEAWSRRLDEARAAETEQMRPLLVQDEPADRASSPAEALRGFTTRGHGDRAMEVLCGDEDLLLVAAEERWLFVRRMKLDDGVITRRAAMRLSDPIGIPFKLQISGDRIRILGAYGALTELDAQTLEAVSWTRPAMMLPDADRGEAAAILAGAHAWFSLGQAGEHGTETVVLDLDSGLVEARLTLTGCLALRGGGERCLLGMEPGRRPRIYHERGRPAPGVPMPLDLIPLAVSVHPDGEGVMALYTDYERLVMGAPLRLQAFWTEGRASEPLTVTTFKEQRALTLVASVEAGLVYLLEFSPEEGGGGRLTAARVTEGERPDVLYTCEIAEDVIFAVEHHSRAVAIMDCGGALGPKVERLGREPPRAGLRREVNILEAMPSAGLDQASCQQILPFCAASREIGATLRSARSAAEALALRQRMKEERSGDDQALHELEVASAVAGRFTPGGSEKIVAGLKAELAGISETATLEDLAGMTDLTALVRRAVETGPDNMIWTFDPSHPEVLLNWGHVLVREQAWEEALVALNDPALTAGAAGAAGGSPLSERQEKHRCHLAGIALFRLERFAEAQATWRRGCALEGPCELEALAELARAVVGGGVEADPPLVRRVVDAIIVADACLARDDARQALAAADQPWTWYFLERQGLARMVESWLRIVEISPVERWFKTYALATYCALWGTDQALSKILIHDVPVPGHVWGKERLEALRRRAEQWLEGGGDGGV